MPDLTIENVRQLGEFAKAYNWKLQFLTAPNVLPFPTDDEVAILCTEAETPKYADESFDVDLTVGRIPVLGKAVPVGTQTFSFVETVDNPISNWLYQLSLLTNNIITGKQGNIEDIAFDIRLTRLDNQKVGVYEFKSIRCFIAEYDSSGGAFGVDSEVVRPTVTLRYLAFTEEDLT
jgi:hypothetical protein